MAPKVQRRSILSQLLLAALVVKVDGLCLLCPAGAAGLKRPYFEFEDNTDGGKVKSCAEKSLEMAITMSSDPLTCQNHIHEFSEICCGDEEPDLPVIGQSTEPPIVPINLRNYPQGEYPECDLCKGNLKYPHDPKMVINILYVDQPGTCEDYYGLGLKGNFRPNICTSLQYYASNACKCRYTAGLAPIREFTDPPTAPPTPSPTPQPSPQPTRQPTKPPTPQPTKPPTPQPTGPTTPRPTNWHPGMGQKDPVLLVSANKDAYKIGNRRGGSAAGAYGGGGRRYLKGSNH